MATTERRVIGKPVGRSDGPDKTTGRGKYSIDLTLPDTLWIKILRSPYPHARIVKVDASEALRLPGVHAVLTGEDVKGMYWGKAIQDEPVLAWDRVRYIGDKDPTTRRLMEGILAMEEEHAEDLATLLEQMR